MFNYVYHTLLPLRDAYITRRSACPLYSVKVCMRGPVIHGAIVGTSQLSLTAATYPVLSLVMRVWLSTSGICANRALPVTGAGLF